MFSPIRLIPSIPHGLCTTHSILETCMALWCTSKTHNAQENTKACNEILGEDEVAVAW